MDVDYYLVLISPWTYLGHARFEDLAARYAANVHYKPVLGGKVLSAGGGLPVKERPPQRQAYRFQELERWRKRLGTPLNLEPKHFPVSDVEAAKAVLALARSGVNPGGLIGAFLRAVWAEERDISDPATIRAIVSENGHDAEALLAAAADPAIQAQYEINTEQAIARNVFGFPTFDFGDQLYWGQDRLDFVAERLQGKI